MIMSKTLRQQCEGLVTASDYSLVQNVVMATSDRRADFIAEVQREPMDVIMKSRLYARRH